jgi:sulfur relay (sulfurtransferase) complex TusBCD TusD component (DsrE family)
MTMPNDAVGLTIAGLEEAYDMLAIAIDQAGEEKAELFLVKLSLLNANALANPALFSKLIAVALNDLNDVNMVQ